MNKKLSHDRLLKPNPKPISDSRPIPILERSGRFFVCNSGIMGYAPPSARVFSTSYRMIYLTCIHSQTTWTRHCGIYYLIYDIGIYGPSVRTCGS